MITARKPYDFRLSFRGALMAALTLVLVLTPPFIGPLFGQNLQAEDAPKNKVILLGFDGVDYRLASQFIDQGQLPHLQAFAEKGTFAPLDTANPAQSPVAWASIVTGTNPGKTNIGGFIRRKFLGGMILPDLVTTEESYDGKTHSLPYSQFSWLNQESKPKWIGIFGVGIFLIGMLLLKVLLRLGMAVSFVGSLILGIGAVFFGFSFFAELPDQVPFPYNRQQGESFWDTLSKNNIRSIGLFAPGAYPVVAEENAEILGGLGVPDITGSTGTWYVYSSEAFTFFDMDTNTGGKVLRLNEEGDGRLSGKIFGPNNFYRIEQFEKQIEALKKNKEDPKMTQGDKDNIDEKLQEKEDEYSAWKSDSKKVTLDLWLTPDYQNQTVQFELEGQTKKIKVGEWTEWFKVSFQMSPFVKVPALVRMRLIKCSDDEIRFFVPPIDISPESPPEYIRLTSPAPYSTTLAERNNLFETVGWACITHGLKDEEIDEDVFMEDIEFTMRKRNTLLRDQLGRKDWDMFFEVFYSTDRVQHMMYRLFDENHPQHNSQLAKRNMSFYGNNITLKDSVLASYQAMDTIVGEVVDRIDSGEFGKDAVLMIVSDHGFAPFYHCVGINNLLIDQGFQVTKADENGEPQTVKSIVNSTDPSMLNFVDWDKSKAYSMGLGKIYINLKGREPKGIVEPEEYDALCKEIIEKFEAFKDPNTGERIVKKVYRRDEIFKGQFWKEGDVDFDFYGPDGKHFTENRFTEGFADLYIGFYPKYRVSWGTSLGGLEEEIIVPNEQKWSGDHVSVDPSEVRGVFFCNKKIRGTKPPHLEDIVPTLLDLYGLKQPEVIDGEAILLEM